jgi:uncharacterized protein YhfF
MSEAEQSDAVRKFWAEFCAQTGVALDHRHDAFAFGDTPAMADELAELVLHGPKRATAGLLADYEGEPLPEVGAYSIVLSGDGQPVCVIRTTDLQITMFRDVDAAFAWDEGEGDRSLDYWRAAHIGCFARMCAPRGATFTDDLATVCERFEVVWPVADPSR